MQRFVEDANGKKKCLKCLSADRRWAVHCWTHPTLCCIDWDDGTDIEDERIPDIWKKLPYTFSSGSGKGLHFWMYCEGMPEGCPGNQVKCLQVGDCDVFFRYGSVFEKPEAELFNWSGSIPAMQYSELLEPYIIPLEFFPKAEATATSSGAFMKESAGLTEADLRGFLTFIDP